MKYFCDLIVCPKCGGNLCYHSDTKELYFDAEGKGSASLNYYCTDCKTQFNINMTFNYDITGAFIKVIDK